MICLTSVVLVDFFGISLIAKAYGNLVFFRGIGFLSGPPIGGEKNIFFAALVYFDGHRSDHRAIR